MTCWDGSFQRFSATGAQSMLETVITMNLSFVVFTFGSLLVVIQVASGQLTPRVIATTLLRDNVVRYTVGLFVFTLLFAISVRNRIEGSGDQLVILVAGVLGFFSMAAFLYLIDYAARLLRPMSILSPSRRNWPYCDQRCLSSTETRPIAAAHRASDYGDALPGSFIMQVDPRSSCR